MNAWFSEVLYMDYVLGLVMYGPGHFYTHQILGQFLIGKFCTVDKKCEKDCIGS